ncbi:MAG: hypothetical protein EOM52_10165 [Clostridia bacterium]|nr:hypothetical protein [Clostridia bacterium]
MKKLPLLLALLFLLAGCGANRAASEEGQLFSVYFTSTTLQSSALTSEERRIPENTARAEGLIRALLSGPATEGLSSPIPAGTRLRSWNVDDDGVLTVDLSEHYGGLSGVDLTLADYCIALTLCQLPNVEAVSITVEGEPISFRAHQLLRSTDVILSGSEDAPIYYSATLYFPRDKGGLSVERRDLVITENVSLSAALLTALMAGPTEAGLSFPFPEDADLLSAYVDGGICYVNFSGQFKDHAPEDTRDRTLLLYSIVNTLCSQPKVTAVHLFVDGSSIESYGNIPTDAPLEPNTNLVVEP